MQESFLLNIFISSDLSSLRFELDGKLLGTIEKPLLLWECSCDPARGGRSPQNGPCRLHSLPDAAIISELFGLNTTIWYRDIPIIWNGQVSWPPSVDAWLFINTLIDYSLPPADATRLWDIGAGTGFLGIQLAHQNTQLKQVMAVEIDSLAADLCASNFEKAGPKNINWEILVKDGRQLMPELFNYRDFIVSAPPYIPKLDGIHDDAGPAFGTTLLEALLRLASNADVPMTILYSSVAHPEVKQMLVSLNLTEEVLAKHTVPFRIGLRPNHFDWLVARGSLQIKPQSVFAYWHEIRIVKINNQRT